MKEDAVRIIEPDTANRRPAPRTWVVVLLVIGVGVAFTLSRLASSDDDLATSPSTSSAIALIADEPLAAWGVTIETLLDVRAPVDSVGSGSFVASGEAVDIGELCTEGFFTTLGTQSGITESGFWYEYEMFCSDRSGTFLLRVSSTDHRLFVPQLASEFDPQLASESSDDLDGTWKVASGSRKFVTLGGSGAVRAAFESDRCINSRRLGVDRMTCGIWVRTYSGEVIRP
jgi:hypothetical protein